MSLLFSAIDCLWAHSDENSRKKKSRKKEVKNKMLQKKLQKDTMSRIKKSRETRKW